jgi:hypothetical protein
MRNILSVAVVLVVLAAWGCGKSDSGTVIAPINAGRGDSGRATIFVIPKHNGVNLDTATVYIKYNAQNAPAGAYDDSAKCVPNAGNPTAKFDSLRVGTYYLYCQGMYTDTTGGINKFVYLSGATSYTIRSQKDSSITLVIPVHL